MSPEKATASLIGVRQLVESFWRVQETIRTEGKPHAGKNSVCRSVPCLTGSQSLEEAITLRHFAGIFDPGLLEEGGDFSSSQTSLGIGQDVADATQDASR